MPALLRRIASVQYSSDPTEVNRITKLGLVVYLIGGPPRCFKSVLAGRLTVELSQPEWRIPMRKGPDRIPRAAAMFEPYLERAIPFLQTVRQAYGIVGEVIAPEPAARLNSGHHLRVVFLVRSSATSADIADSRGPNPWLAAAEPYAVSSVTAEVVSWSRHVRSACRRLRIPCFDVGEGFERAVTDAASALMADARPE